MQKLYAGIIPGLYKAEIFTSYHAEPDHTDDK